MKFFHILHTVLHKGGYTRRHFLNMYLSVLHEHMRGNTCCCGDGRAQNIIVLLVILGKRDDVQVNIRCVVVFVVFNTP